MAAQIEWETRWCAFWAAGPDIAAGREIAILSHL
jgi:hypothetical protein